jgi:hypothetical protein
MSYGGEDGGLKNASDCFRPCVLNWETLDWRLWIHEFGGRITNVFLDWGDAVAERKASPSQLGCEGQALERDRG